MLYSCQLITLQIFFRVSHKELYLNLPVSTMLLLISEQFLLWLSSFGLLEVTSSAFCFHPDIKILLLKKHTKCIFIAFVFFGFFFINEFLTLIRLGFLRVVFPGGGGGQFDPPFIFLEELI